MVHVQIALIRQTYNAFKPKQATSVKLICELTGKTPKYVKNRFGFKESDNTNNKSSKKSDHKNNKSKKKSENKSTKENSGTTAKQSKIKEKSSKKKNVKTNNATKEKSSKKKSKSKKKSIPIDLTGLNDSIDESEDFDIDAMYKDPSQIRKKKPKYAEYKAKIQKKKRNQMSDTSESDCSVTTGAQNQEKQKEKTKNKNPKAKRHKPNKSKKIKIQEAAITKPDSKSKSKTKLKFMSKTTRNQRPFLITVNEKALLSKVIRIGCKDKEYPRITIKTVEIEKWKFRRQCGAAWNHIHFGADSLKDYLGQFDKRIRCGNGINGVGIFADKQWNIRWFGDKPLCCKENKKNNKPATTKLNLHLINTCASETLHWYMNDSKNFLEAIDSLIKSWPTDEEILQYIQKRNPLIKWDLLPEWVLQYLGGLEYCINVKMLEFGLLNGDILRNKIFYDAEQRTPSFVTNFKSPDFVAQNNGGYKFRDVLDPAGIEIWQRVGYHKLSCCLSCIIFCLYER